MSLNLSDSDSIIAYYLPSHLREMDRLQKLAANWPSTLPVGQAPLPLSFSEYCEYERVMNGTSRD